MGRLLGNLVVAAYGAAVVFALYPTAPVRRALWTALRATARAAHRLTARLTTR